MFCVTLLQCKYVYRFQTATGGYKSERECLHFDVRAGGGAWEYSSQARGRGVLQGTQMAFVLIEPFYLWSQPHLYIFTKRQHGKPTASPLGREQQ